MTRQGKLAVTLLAVSAVLVVAVLDRTIPHQEARIFISSARLSHPSDDERSCDTDPVSALGDTLRNEGLEYTVFGAQRWTPVDPLDTPARGMHYEAVDVEVTNTTTQPLGRGRVYVARSYTSRYENSRYGCSGLAPELPDEFLAGATSRGYVCFEVPDHAPNLVFVAYDAFPRAALSLFEEPLSDWLATVNPAQQRR